MFCENCGNQIPNTAAFCTKCGAKTGGVQAGAQAGKPAQSTPPVQRGKPSSSYQQGAVPPVARPAPNVPPTVARSRSEVSASHRATSGQPSQSHIATPGQSESSPVGSGVMSYKDYMVMMLLVSIPLLNIILLIKWGFGGEVNPNKRNFAKAMLTYMVIATILGAIWGGIIASMATRMYY